MITLNVLDTQIICGDKAELRQAWKDKTEDRHKLWLQEEVAKHLLSDPSTIQKVIDAKRKSPGCVV
jgi:hypothetical protein